MGENVVCMKKRNNLIDMLKFTATLMVVGIHSGPLNSFEPLLNNIIFQGIARLAVPFFFGISAYFLYRKISLAREEEKKKILYTYLKRLGLLYLFWFIIMFSVCIELRYTKYVSEYEKKGAIIIFINSLLWSSSFQGSWYLNASMICAVIIFVIAKMWGNKIAFVISGVAFLCTTFLSAYYGLVSPYIGSFYEKCNIYFFPPNSFMAGMIYFVMGKYIAETEKTKLVLWKKRKIALVISLFGVLCEAIFMHTHNYMQEPDCFFMLVPATYFIMINCIYCEKQIRLSEKVMRFLRESSIIMYIIHFRVLKMWGEITINGEVFFSNSLYKYIATVVVCLMISYIILTLEKVKMFRFLKYSH